MILQLVAEVLIILYLIFFIAELGQSFSGSLGWFISLGVLYFIQWTWFLWQAANSKRDSAITQTLRNILSHASFKHFKLGLLFMLMDFSFSLSILNNLFILIDNVLLFIFVLHSWASFTLHTP